MLPSPPLLVRKFLIPANTILGSNFFSEGAGN